MRQAAHTLFCPLASAFSNATPPVLQKWNELEGQGTPLPQIDMEAHRGPSMQDNNLTRPGCPLHFYVDCEECTASGGIMNCLQVPPSTGSPSQRDCRDLQAAWGISGAAFAVITSTYYW